MEERKEIWWIMKKCENEMESGCDHKPGYPDVPQPLEHDGTTLKHAGTTLKHEGTILEHDCTSLP